MENWMDISLANGSESLMPGKAEVFQLTDKTRVQRMWADTVYDENDVDDYYAPSNMYCGSDDPKTWLNAWKIDAVGHRPDDYFVRDLLHSSLLRDPRPRWYHRYCQRPGAWILDRIDHLPDQDQPAA